MSRRSQISFTEEELVQLLRDKNKAGLEFLYDKYSAALFGVVVRIVQRDEIAEDVLQEAFLKIWHSFESFNPEKGRLFTWIVNITRNLAIDKIRSKEYRNSSKNQDIENTVSIIDSAGSTSVNPDTIGLKELTGHLKPDQKIIVDLIYFQGFTHVEVSEKLNIPLGTVKTRLRMAIILLRKYFNELRADATIK